MDIQIGKGGNVDFAISRCADVAINFIGVQIISTLNPIVLQMES